MGSTEAKTYNRLRISGRLTCAAALHVGDGGDADFKPRSQDPKAEGLYRSVCRDADDRPYIPATTLRGYLREVAGPALAPALFGQIKGNQGLVGKVRVFDATWLAAPGDTRLPYWDQRLATGIRHGIGIDPITGTVGDHLLYRHEIVPAGTTFSWTLEAEGLTDDQFADLLGLLATFDGKSDSGVGRGRSRIEGGLTWVRDRVDGITDAALVAWLDDTDTKTLTDALEVIASPPAERRPQRRTGPQIDLILTPTGPLLINEPGLVTLEPERPAGTPEDPDGPHDPDLEFSRTPDGKAIIPAASLRGLLRGRARRILATIAAGYGAPAPGVLAEAMVGLLFGITGRRGRIHTSEAVATSPASDHLQTFVAIDRFTGGGERGKLYQARAALSGPLKAKVRIEIGRGELADWEKGLLLLLARDACEGELAAGWGKARGYGALDIALSDGKETLSNLPALRAWIDREFKGTDPGGWIEALHDEVAKASRPSRPPSQSISPSLRETDEEAPDGKLS